MDAEMPDFRSCRAMFQQMSKTSNAPPQNSTYLANLKGHRFSVAAELGQQCLRNEKAMPNANSFIGKPVLIQKPFALPRVQVNSVVPEKKIEEANLNPVHQSITKDLPLVDSEPQHWRNAMAEHQEKESCNLENGNDFRRTLLIWEKASNDTIKRKTDPQPPCVGDSPTAIEKNPKSDTPVYPNENEGIFEAKQKVFPCIKPLPPIDLLGAPPKKPKRPPLVDLSSFLASSALVDEEPCGRDAADHCPSTEISESYEEPETYEDVISMREDVVSTDASQDTEHYHNDYVALIPEKEVEPVNCKTVQNEVTEDIYYDVEGMTGGINQMESSTFTSDSFSENSGDVYDDIHNFNNEDNRSTKSDKDSKLKGLGRIFKKNKEKVMQKNIKSKENGIWKATSVTNLKADDPEADSDAVYNDVENGIAQHIVKKGNEKQPKKRLPMFLFNKEGKEKRKSSVWVERGLLKNKAKKMAKEEKLFREKFEYTKEIEVLNTAMVDPSANIGKQGKQDLPIRPGEELDIIDITDGNIIICRNSGGKYGYVLVDHLIFRN
ncbi:FYN-binding protein 2 isoform X2 [Ambystoma mexicanum]|uniref:FYN-binding protein 2 isoform X2 n=1 Tax=Ambystoma mexicanum TaxID=8296 RepID=UPI0037E75B19